MNDDVEEKVKLEYREVERKLHALEDFINHDMHSVVDCVYHRRLLQEQCVTLRMYRNILNQRVALFSAKRFLSERENNDEQ
tara:strand:+ start:896 stop:1138 length:243 start_codon:yes stop_codon:yes gene_type:complete